MRLRLGIAALAAAALLAPRTGQASELEVYSNTQLNVQSQWREGATTTVVPLYEFLSLTGREVEIPGGRLYFQVDGWGAANMGSNPWWNGFTNTGAMSADLDLAYVQARWLDNSLRVTLGRQSVGYGNSRMLQLDGGAVQWVIHKMFTVDAYVGVPTTQRFTAYGNIYSSNPTIGNLATGGRLGFAWSTWVNVGASAAFSWDDGYATRQDLAVDLRFSPVSWMYLLGYIDWSLYANTFLSEFGNQIADSNLTLVFPVTPHLQFTADYVYSVPSLSLPYNSILWVFSDTTHQYAGVSARVGLEALGLHVPIDVELAYRRIFEEFTDFGNSNTAGNRYIGRATWRASKTTSVGAEVSRLWMPATTTLGGFWQTRAFASAKALGFTGTLDFQGYWYDVPVNAVTQSIIGSATLGYDIGNGLSIVGAVSGGTTPFYSSYVNGLVKISYNGTYRSREVY